MNIIMKKFNNLIFPANRYYKMTDSELEKIASLWHVNMYGTNNGLVSRQIIIDALIKKDQINFSFWSIIISCIALVISIMAIIK